MGPVQLTEVSVVARKRAVLDQVSLRCDGGVTVVVGPRGSGASELARLIATGLMPTAGRVEVAGFDVADPDQRRSARSLLAYVPPTPTFPTGHTVLDAVAYAAWMRKLDPVVRSDAVTAALREVGIAGLAGRTFGELTVGQRRAVFVAMALVHDPAVVVLEDPIAGVDPTYRQILGTAVRRVGERATVVVTTHDEAAVHHFGGRVVTLARGRLAGPVVDADEWLARRAVVADCDAEPEAAHAPRMSSAASRS